MEWNTESEITANVNKVLIIGDSFVGKTSIARRFIENSFSPEAKPTIGCDFFQAEVSVEDQKVRLAIWDTAGQERYRGLANCFYKRVKAIVLVFDLTKLASFSRLSYWLNEVEQYGEGQPLMVLVGNKSDLVHQREVTRELAEGFMKAHNFKVYLETSALTNENMAIQSVFGFIAAEFARQAPQAPADLRQSSAGKRRSQRLAEH